MGFGMAGCTDLQFATRDELIDELMRRFPCGVLYMEQDVVGGGEAMSGKTFIKFRLWGPPTWAIGATGVLSDIARSEYYRVMRPFPRLGGEGGKTGEDDEADEGGVRGTESG